MKKTVTTLLLGLGAIMSANAQTFTEWQNPNVNAVNKMPVRASFFPYESLKAAQENQKAASERFLSLDGTWKFQWVEHADMRPTTFFRTDYDDRAWGQIPVPGMWELYGYGDPMYTNVEYPWSNYSPNNPPHVTTEKNHVGSYRREIEIPASWSGDQIIAHFGSVTSNLYLWINGKFVGYSEDSKVYAEFDITKYVKPGKNLFAMQVFRWCDGSYFEDQDFFRLSGFARESFLFARDKRHIEDINMTTTLSENYTKGQLNVELRLPAAARKTTVEVALTDADGQEVARQSIVANGTKEHLTLDAGNVKLWSAETPYLYNVTVSMKSGDKVIETIPLHTGFREVKIENAQLLVNGQPVLMKGANRHELDPDGGYVISRERMLQDIKIFKENNLNAVRTCHYPDDPYWYDLCDRYGLYVIAEANLETHGMGYGKESLAKDPLYEKTHIERNANNLKCHFNHPSVIIWSMGNEAGDGVNFSACYKWLKENDSTRPVHYERTIDEPGTPNTDIMCPMYWGYERCEEYLKNNPTKPLIQCEYAHAMGNSMGGFGRYWELIRKYPNYQGGFIWDFVDQSLRKKGKNGVMVYGYGGDWNPYDVTLQNFCDNGLINPDRVNNPHMNEVRYWHQPIWTTLENNNTLSIFNENFFASTANCYLRWTVLRDGVAVRSGIVSDLDIAPRKTGKVELPLTDKDINQNAEMMLNVEYILKDAEPLLAPGHRVATQQFALNDTKVKPVEIAPRHIDAHTSVGEVNVKTNHNWFLIVETPVARIDFNRRNGLITRYDYCGQPMLAEGSSLRPNFWRAGTDNDFGAGLNSKNRVWENPGMQLSSLHSMTGDGLAIIIAKYALTEVDGLLTLEYRINNMGEIVVKQGLTAGNKADVPDLLRFGMRMEMPEGYDQIDYYGRGPWENYADRKDGALVGRYQQTVDEQFYFYIRPQETGTKSDVRFWRQTNKAGRGLEFTASTLFSASALHYTQESLDEGNEKRQMHTQEVEPVKEVCLTIDGAQYGLGCVNSWGELPEEEHRIKYENHSFEFKITPLKRQN